MADMKTTQQLRLRADEAAKKAGLTLGELAEFVDKARELGIDPSTPVYGDTLIRMTESRRGGIVRWIEV